MLARDERAAAGRAGGCAHKGIAKEHAFFGDAVEVGRAGDVVDPALAVDFCIGAGATAPIVGEDEENVWPFIGGDGLRGTDENRESEEASEASDHGLGADVPILE